MSLKSDEFEEINYSALSGNKNEKSEEIQFNNEINNDNNNKKCLHKSLSLSGINYNKDNNNTFPKININKYGKKYSGKKFHLTSNSFNTLKNNYNSFTDNADKSLNLTSNLICHNNNDEKNIKIKKNSKKENQEYPQIDDIKKIKSKKNNNSISNSFESKQNIINILNLKSSNINKTEENKEANFQESQRIKKEYDILQKEYEKKENSINSLKEEEKISKNDELEMKNRILEEQLKKLNYLYFDVLSKLIEYEDSIKNIHMLKESKIKKDYILLELEYKYSQLLSEMNKKEKIIEELKFLFSKKNSQLKQLQKKLDYYVQLSQKLLIDSENIYINPKILALKNEYESKINENKKSLAFYKEENYKKDKIILELNNGKRNLKDLYNNANYKVKCCNFKNAQKITKEYFNNKDKKENDDIIKLKEKINILQEKNDKLSKKIKEYENNERCLKRYKSSNTKKNKKFNYKNNNDNLDKDDNNIEKIIIKKPAIINSISYENKEEDIDFMSNSNEIEFLYILKKCFEAQSIHFEDLKNKIFIKDTFNLLNQKNNYKIFIDNISDNIIKILKVVKAKDKIDISSFVKTFLFNYFIEQGSNIDDFHKNFINSFKDMNIYDNNTEEKYIKKLARYLKDKLIEFKNEFEMLDFNKRGIITFIGLKKIIEKLKINIKNDILEYMIFFMKRASININDINNINNYSLRDLNYKIFLDKITSLIKSDTNLDTSFNSNISAIENPNNIEGVFNPNLTEENSLIEITTEEYNEKILLIMNSISSEILKKCNKNMEDFINKLFNKYIISDENNHQIIELSKLIEEIKNSLFIELSQIEIFCLYSKFQIKEEKNINNSEFISYDSFKNEILLCINQLMNKNSFKETIIEKNSENKINEEKKLEQKIGNEENKKEEGQNEEYNDFEKKDVYFEDI